MRALFLGDGIIRPTVLLIQHRWVNPARRRMHIETRNTDRVQNQKDDDDEHFAIAPFIASPECNDRMISRPTRRRRLGARTGIDMYSCCTYSLLDSFVYENVLESLPYDKTRPTMAIRSRRGLTNYIMLFRVK
jgi:hypothetical protein